jgi:small subunit ribosomal protein S20
VAHSLSAQKRVRQNEKHRLRNRAEKSELKNEVKKLEVLIHDRKIEEAKKFLMKIYKALDQSAAKGVIHSNTAARKKSRLALHVAALEAPAGAVAKKA